MYPMYLESAHLLHPRINLVGETNGGKSSLLAAIIGISVNTPTSCPTEWHVQRSDAWSARVSVGYFSRARSVGFFTATDRKVITVDGSSCFCSMPQQIRLLVKMAEIMAFAPIDDFQSILSMEDEEIDQAHMRQLYSPSHSTGVVFRVELHCPVFEHSELTIVDLPGLTEAGNAENTSYIRQIIRHYVLQKESITVVVARATDHEQHVSRSALSYVEQVVRENATQLDVTVTVALSFNHESDIPFSKSWTIAFSGNKKPKYDLYTFLLPTSQSGGPISFLSATEMQAIRQEESAYFQFVKPWCAYKERERRHLGVTNILKAWHEKTQQRNAPLFKNAASRSTNSWMALFLMRLVLVFFVVSFVATLVVA